jgi:hypothetical protein
MDIREGRKSVKDERLEAKVTIYASPYYSAHEPKTDGLLETFQQNAIPIEQANEIMRESYLIMGYNKVLCNVFPRLVFEGGEKTRNIVTIVSQPAKRWLPQELLNELEKRGYEKQELTEEFLEKYKTHIPPHAREKIKKQMQASTPKKE